MQPTQTGIAVALALTVVIIFFILPGLSPFGGVAPVNVNNENPEITNIETSPNTMPTETITELQIIDEVIGIGDAAAAGDNVTVNYVGSLTNGTVFDASADHGTAGFTFPLGAGQVIQGWDKGIVGMKVGGKRKLVIPASLAYGDRAVGGGRIPANSALIFEVELLKIQKVGR